MHGEVDAAVVDVAAPAGGAMLVAAAGVAAAFAATCDVLAKFA